MTLEAYEDEVLLAMYNEGIISYAYKPIQIVRSKIGWNRIATNHGVKKKFDRVVRHLAAKGYIDLHGKRGDVCSLNQLGISYVRGRTKHPEA